MTALVFGSVRKTFGSTVALESLDLELRTGELVSLLGPSGCGKTTALRIAAGFEKADAGRVSVNGNDISHLAAHKRNMGMVFQSYSLFPNLSVGENVEFGLRTRKMEKSERLTRVGETLELVQLSALTKRYPHQLSGGQQQRVALARALAVRPEVLLLDEPLSALDAKVRATLRDEIRRIQTELNITTLFVTHDQEEALAISDRVGVMSNGRLEQLGSPVEVYRHPSSAFVARFVGSMNEFPATVAGPRAVRVGSAVFEVPAPGGGDGTAVMMLVRPEDVRIDEVHSNGGTSLPGVVSSLTFQGVSSIVGVRLKGPPLMAGEAQRIVSVHVSGASSTPPIGTAVSLRVDTARAVCEPVAPA